MLGLTKALDKQVLFYNLQDDNQVDKSICRIINFYYKKKLKILIIGEDKSQIDTLNDLLWTFEQISFLPHKIYDPEVTLDTPILLLTEKYLNNLLIFKEYDSIINNLDEPIIQAENHFKVYEFVESSEEKKIISRKKYTIYKNNNFDLNHKKYNG